MPCRSYRSFKMMKGWRPDDYNYSSGEELCFSFFFKTLLLVSLKLAPELWQITDSTRLITLVLFSFPVSRVPGNNYHIFARKKFFHFFSLDLYILPSKVMPFGKITLSFWTQTRIQILTQGRNHGKEFWKAFLGTLSLLWPQGTQAKKKIVRPETGVEPITLKNFFFGSRYDANEKRNPSIHGANAEVPKAVLLWFGSIPVHTCLCKF